LLSGRTHRVYTGICLVTPRDALRTRLVETRIRFKRLSSDDLESYLASGEWRGKAGSRRRASRFISAGSIRPDRRTLRGRASAPIFEHG
jgi:predicted house-cleaning NTP pyrophosphatase (Maf/HAM1 superfamily)